MPQGWTVSEGFRGNVRDEAFDTLFDANRQNAIACWRSSDPAGEPLAALEDYALQARAEFGDRPDLRTVGFSLNGVPMLRIVCPLPQERLAVHHAAVTRHRRVVLQLTGLVGSHSDTLSAHIEELLGRIEFPQRDVPLPKDLLSPPASESPPEVPAGWITSYIGNVTLSVPPDWTASDFAATDEGMWFQGGDVLLPAVSFHLVRDTPLDELLRAGTTVSRNKTSLGRWPAEEILVEGVETLAGLQQGLVILVHLPIRGERIALAGFAPNDQWDAQEEVFRKVTSCVRIQLDPVKGSEDSSDSVESHVP